MNIEVKTALFANGLGASLKCVPGLTVGGTFPQNDGGTAIKNSEYRAKSATSAIRVSFAAIALERLLKSDLSFAKIGKDTLYACQKAGAGTYECVAMRKVDGTLSVSEIGALAGIKQTELLLVIDVLHEIVFGSNTELRHCFDEIKYDYKRLGGTVRRELVALFCDSFYYGCAMVNSTVVTESISSPEEIDGLVRLEGIGPVMELSDTSHPVVERISGRKGPERKKKEQKDDDIAKIFADCLDGKYIIPYRWAEEQADYLQPLSALDGFIPSRVFGSLVTKIKYRLSRVLARVSELDISKPEDRVKAIGKDYINLTLSGKPGTGKTRLAYALGAATGLPVYTISNSHNTDEDEYQGMTRMVDGKPMAVPTDAVRCFEHGGILLLEEINLPQSAVIMGALGQAVEFPFLLKKDGYIPIRRHPLCVIISTMNTGTQGSKVLSQPFANRFKQSYVLDDPEKNSFIKILEQTESDERICKWVYGCYERVVSCIEKDNAVADVESILLSLSLRSCIGAIENIQEGMEPREAVRNSIIGKISEQDMAVAKSCDKVLKSVPDPVF